MTFDCSCHFCGFIIIKIEHKNHASTTPSSQKDARPDLGIILLRGEERPASCGGSCPIRPGLVVRNTHERLQVMDYSKSTRTIPSAPGESNDIFFNSSEVFLCIFSPYFPWSNAHGLIFVISQELAARQQELVGQVLPTGILDLQTKAENLKQVIAYCEGAYMTQDKITIEGQTKRYLQVRNER
jgi:hypothetical protein